MQWPVLGVLGFLRFSLYGFNRRCVCGRFGWAFEAHGARVTCHAWRWLSRAIALPIQ